MFRSHNGFQRASLHDTRPFLRGTTSRANAGWWSLESSANCLCFVVIHIDL